MKLILKYLKNYKLLFFFNVISVFGFILVELGNSDHCSNNDRCWGY